MARIRQLNWYQRGILILLLALALVFAVIYRVRIARVGFLYQDKIFVPSEENGATVYSGKISGEPALSDILRLVYGPELTHKGSWLAWFGAVFISLLNAGSILYADELFRWDLSFQIQNAETAVASEWEMMKRYLSWTVLTIAVLVIYIVGLRA